MRLYSTRQLVVILLLVTALGIFCGLRPAFNGDGEALCAAERAAYVYELRGDIRHEGYYSFRAAPGLAELLKACGGLKKGGTPAAGDPDRRFDSGSRIVLGEDVRVVPMDARALLNFYLPLRVNGSSAEDLALIPGIGLHTARAIVSYRDARGAVRDLGELTAVRGIGEKRLRKLRQYLVVDSQRSF